MQLGDNAWAEANWQYLQQGIIRVQSMLNPDENNPSTVPIEPLEPSNLSPFSTLEQICEIFGLSEFERDILLLCAGMDLAPDWEALCVAATGNSQRNYPTFHLATMAFSQVNWQAIQPQSALRRWQLVELGPSNSVAHSLLRIDEQILHALTGGYGIDERLARFQLPLFSELAELSPTHQARVSQMAQVWLQASSAQRSLPYLQLWGEDDETKRTIALSLCKHLGLHEMLLAAEQLPTDTVQIDTMRCLCEREWLLHQRVLILNCEWVGAEQPEQGRASAQLVDRLTTPVIVLTRDRRPQRLRLTMAYEVERSHPSEQRLLWQQSLGNAAEDLNGHIEHLTAHFNLSAADIQTVSMQALTHQPETPANDNSMGEAENPLPSQLWTLCREKARPQLDNLAQRIHSTVSWDDLVLPEKELEILQSIAAHVKQRTKVYEQWGFGKKSQRGLGISALFSGASGTGKTLAAEILANELKLDLYRIDLSAVVSKYIGETEKNLRRVFDAAEGGGAVLLFDEADALFGKRSEVNDSRDRHANIEVSYLLQRMEAYRGLAILTTNLKNTLDQAFLRRLRFVVQFPFPNVSQRAAIWRQAFPPQMPTTELDYGRLAKLTIAGGNIRNIALNAAFSAANTNEPMSMKTLLQAVKNEYEKIGRPFTRVELQDLG